MSILKPGKVSEKAWVNIYALLLILVTGVPYLFGYFLQNENWQFSGFVFGVEDGNSYIAKMLNGANAEWLFRTPYTGMEQNGALAFFPYMLLGKLTSTSGQHEQLVALFQLFRAASVFVLVWAIYLFSGCFIQKVQHKRFTTVLITLGGGLGFLTLLGVKFGGYGNLPLEFYSPETFGFLAILGLPHLAAARACLLGGFVLLIKHQTGSSILKTGAMVGGLWTLLGFFQPLTVVIAWTILCVAFLIDLTQDKVFNQQTWIGSWRNLKEKRNLAIVSLCFSFPIPLYSLISFYVDPFLKLWTDQNLILSPPVLDYLAAFILILPFAIAGSLKIIKLPVRGGGILLAWVVLFPILAYAPYNLQRRLPEGIWVSLCVLAVIYIEQTEKSRLIKWKPILYTGFLSTFLLWMGTLAIVITPSLPVYLPSDEVQVVKYLAKRPDHSIVLANFEISNAIPAWAYKRTLIGHGPESVNLKVIQPKVERLLSGSLSDNEAQQLLKENDVNYILFSPEDSLTAAEIKQLGAIVFSSGDYRLVEVAKRE